MESDRLCLDLAFLHVDFVTAEDDGDVLAHTDEITWGMCQWRPFNTNLGY